MKLKNFLAAKISLKELIKNSPLPYHETRIILRDVFGFDDSEIIKNPQISNQLLKKFNKMSSEIAAGYPLQYAIGFTYFLDAKINVNRDVLIPRPESEEIVELAREFLSERTREKTTIIDVGTGSGCISIALKKLFEQLTNFDFFAVDLSQKALKVAQKNATLNKTDIVFLKSDLLDNKNLPQRFDLITANLPYIDTISKITELRFEPDSALYCADEGFELIERLIRQLPQRLTKDGLAISEIGYNHTLKIQEIAKEMNQLKFSIQKDLNNHPRYLLVRPKKDMPLV